jgi:hypothetical protein
VQKNQTVSEMAEEVMERQAKALAHRNGRSLEDARQAVTDTEAGRQLKDLANGEHRHEKAHEWQGGVFWERAEQRSMRLYCSEALSRFATEGPYSWLERHMEWLEGKQERERYYALLEEELAGPRGDTLRRASSASSEARKRCSRAPASVCRGREISENPLAELLRTPSRDCPKSPDGGRTCALPGEENGSEGPPLGASRHQRPCLEGSTTTFRTVSKRSSENASCTHSGE